MPAREATSRAAPLWRSKLRRLRTLSAWHRALAQDAAPAAVEEPITLPAPKRRRADSEVPASPLKPAAAAEQEKTAPAAPAAERPAAAENLPPTEQPAAAPKRRKAEAAPTSQAPAEAEKAEPKPAATKPSRKRKASLAATSSCTALAVRVVVGAKRKPTPPAGPPSPPKAGAAAPKPAEAQQTAERTAGSAASTPAAPRPKLDAVSEIQRILAAEAPEDMLGLGPTDGTKPSEEVVTQAWKKLVLLLHPDKLQRFGEQCQQDGAEALHRVHLAKDELRRCSQAVCAQVPAEPQAAAPPRCSDSQQGARKYEISWRLPEAQDPARPVEAYEVWGPRYFSEGGDPFDWVMLAKLPALQSTFVIVEEAPTQQDVMWAADRVLRPTLPLTVHAVNGRGQSEALTFELPWGTNFPWLQGTPSVLCTQCFRMSACRGPWTKCGGCSASVPGESRIVVRCPECQGEVLWAHNSNLLRCTCCLKVFGKDCGQQWRPGTKPFHQAPPLMKQQQQFNSGAPQRPTPPPRPPPRGGVNGQWHGGRGAGAGRKAW